MPDGRSDAVPCGVDWGPATTSLRSPRRWRLQGGRPPQPHPCQPGSHSRVCVTVSHTLCAEVMEEKMGQDCFSWADVSAKRLTQEGRALTLLYL